MNEETLLHISDLCVVVNSETKELAWPHVFKNHDLAKKWVDLQPKGLYTIGHILLEEGVNDG